MTDRERTLELLLSRATEGLSEEETRELERALTGHPEIDSDELDLAAAAAHLVFAAGEPAEPMPAELRQRIASRAADYLPAPGGEGTTGSLRTKVVPIDRRPERKTRLGGGALGWYAAAAMLVLAAVGVWSMRPTAPVAPPSLVEQRTSLVEGAEDLIEAVWAPPESSGFAAVTGDVVWSNDRQAGFMRLRGMPANRSAVEQYQLWIVDPSRDEHPIDGGVFDIPAGRDEVIVPIDAKLGVTDPKAFAITLEKPGGVVVSDGPLLVVAPVDA